MPASPRTPRRGSPRFLLHGNASPDSGALQVITNAIHAALEYSPLQAAPTQEHNDVYAYVLRQIEDRFWSDIYVERPEVRDLFVTLETGHLVIVTGERGTGKSTAIRAVVRELPGRVHESAAAGPRGKPELLSYVFDANTFTEELGDEQAVSEVIHREVYQFLDRQITDRQAWVTYLQEHHAAFGRFRLALDADGWQRRAPADWAYLAGQADYKSTVERGFDKFEDGPFSDQVRTLLQFMGTQTSAEPLIVIDNVDHLSNDAVRRCGEALAWILASSPHRIRGAIAVRPENADELQHVLDNAVRPLRISMTLRPLTANEYDTPPIDVTLRFLEKRLAVLREPATVDVMRSAIDARGASRLAESAALEPDDSVNVFLGSVLELLEVMIYDVFRTDEENAELRQDNWEFARAIHLWHNGSLRECALSLTMFASDILQDKTHMYKLRDLLQTVIDTRHEPSLARRASLRRITRSLLYRHLLFWAAPEGEPIRPLKNVMVFEGHEETSDPPIHFLRLRLLQYLARRERGRATVAHLRHEFKRLDIERHRVDEELRQLAIKRTHDDAGLIRVDGLSEADVGAVLRADAIVQLLDAGRFLVDKLYVTTEYLFWSALNATDPESVALLPRKITSEDIQDDAFRISVAIRFLELHLIGKFRDEHPYLHGFSQDWPPERAKRRLRLYERLFGFSKEDWFLDRAARSVGAFIPSRDPRGRFAESREAVARVRNVARRLDLAVSSAG